MTTQVARVENTTFNYGNSLSPMAGVDGRPNETLAQYLANNAVYNVLDYGADNTGVVDIATSITLILAARSSTPSVLYFPAGRYLLANYDFAGASDLILLGDPGMTTITGGTHTVLNFSNPLLSGVTSQRIFQSANASNITCQDIIFDGNQATGPVYYAGNYPDVCALLEFRTCSNVRILNCTVINFTPLIPAVASGGNPNPSRPQTINQGPLWFDTCNDVKILDWKLLTPCYGEGGVLYNCTRVRVERMYSNAGRDTDVVYGTSTPLHVVGPLCADVIIRDSTWYRSNGSSLEVGAGVGPVSVLGNVVNGGGGFNIALANVGFYDDYDITGLELAISHNKFVNVTSNTNSKIPGIYIGSRVDGMYQYQNVVVHGNTFDSVYSAIAVRGCLDVSIMGNVASRIFRSTAGAASSEGQGITVVGCARVTVANNTLEMSQIAAPNRAQYGVLMYDSEDVAVSENQCVDASISNFTLGTQDRYTLAYTGGGTALRDMLWQNIWLGTAYTITGQTSGATLTVSGRTITSGSFVAGTAAGVIYGSAKVGTFVAAENLQLNATTGAAVAGGDAALASWFNRLTAHDNQSVTLTTTTTPYAIQPVGVNTMIGQYMRSNNQHNGTYIDPLDVALNVGDANVTLTNYTLPVVQTLSALTAARTWTFPATPAFNGQKRTFLKSVTSAFPITLQTDAPATVFTMPPYVRSRVTLQYNQGWRVVDFALLDQPIAISSNAAPTVGTWTQGQFVFNTGVATANILGWVCTVAGTPGTWVAIYVPGASELAHSTVALTNGAGAGAGTITNAPSAGNPTKWIPINDAGTTRHIPAW